MGKWAVWLVLPICSGCLAGGYPTISHTPALAVDGQGVQAFRVVTDHNRGVLFGGCRSDNQTPSDIQAVPVIANNLPAQNEVYMGRFVLLWPFLYVHFSQSTQFVLYRPGFEAVVVPSEGWWHGIAGHHMERISWKEAPDLSSQEKALDTVIPAKHLSAIHLDTLDWAAREYTRIAQSSLASGPAMEAARNDLLYKARCCEEEAAERRKNR